MEHASVDQTALDAARWVQVDKETISEVMRAMGSRGGRAGGRKRMDSLSPEERSALAKKAVDAREAKRAALKKEVEAAAPPPKKAAAKSAEVRTKNAAVKKSAAKKKTKARPVKGK